MTRAFFPEIKRITVINGIVYIKNNSDYFKYLKISWIELVLFNLTLKVGEEHGKQAFTTPSWSKHMIRQKLVNEFETHNPIDTLYDIWKNPFNYSQNL